MSLTLPIEIGRLYRRRDGAMLRTIFGAEQFINMSTGRVDKHGMREQDGDLVEGPLDEPATGHPHAAAMMEYAKDAVIHPEPWGLWQYFAQDQWRDIEDGHPRWEPATQYRRKPRTIRIGERDVPEPLRVAPAVGANCWFIHLHGPSLVEPIAFADCDWQRRSLERGLLHATREGAMAHAEALVELSK